MVHRLEQSTKLNESSDTYDGEKSKIRSKDEGHAFASMISIPFCSHSFRSICPISARSSPYITCRLYFGANTT